MSHCLRVEIHDDRRRDKGDDRPVYRYYGGFEKDRPVLFVPMGRAVPLSVPEAERVKAQLEAKGFHGFEIVEYKPPMRKGVPVDRGLHRTRYVNDD